MLAAWRTEHYRPSGAAARATAKPGPPRPGPTAAQRASWRRARTEAKRPSPPKRRNSLKPGLCVLARGRRAASKKGAADGGAGDQRRPRFCMAAERSRPHEAPRLTFPPLSTVLGEAQNEPLRPGGGWERGVKGGKRRGAEWGRQSDRKRPTFFAHKFAPVQARRLWARGRPGASEPSQPAAPLGAWAAGETVAEARASRRSVSPFFLLRLAHAPKFGPYKNLVENPVFYRRASRCQAWGVSGSNTILHKFVSYKNLVKNPVFYRRAVLSRPPGVSGSSIPTHTN